MKTAVILPTFNEKDNIQPLVQEIFLNSPTLHILIVDDNSPDGTGQLAQKLAQSDSRIHVIHRKGPRGRGVAGIEGFCYAIEEGYETILEMDADFSHAPSDIPRFLEEAKTHDIVIGSRFVVGGGESGRSLFRRVLSKLSNAYIRRMLHLEVRDTTSGFRCFKRDVLKSIHVENFASKGPSIVPEILKASQSENYSFKEIPIHFTNRRAGKSKLSFFKLLDSFLMIWRIKFKK